MINKNIFGLLLAVACFILLAWVFSNIFAYFAIALVLSAIFSPLTNYIHKIHFYGLQMPRLIAVFMAFAVIISLISLFLGLLIPVINNQLMLIMHLDYMDLYNKVSRPLQGIEEVLISNNLVTQEEGFLVNSFREGIFSLISNLKFGQIVNNLIAFTGNIFVGLLAVVFITFILLYEKGIIRRQLVKRVPNKWFEIYVRTTYKIETLLANYLIGLLFQVFLLFCLAAVGLEILGVRYALTIAMFAAIANIIPYLGPIIGAIFGLIVGMSTLGFQGTGQEVFLLFIKIASVFAMVQVTDNLLLQPLIFSKSVKAHPLEIFIAIFAGANLSGIVGMIVAIPGYIILRAVISEVYLGYKQYQVFKK